MDDARWIQLRETWQRTDVDTGRARDDWHDKQRARRWTLVGELGALLWVAAFTAFFMWRDPRPVMIVCCVFVDLFVVGSLAYTWWNRRTLARTLPADTARFMDVLEHHHLVETRLHRAGRWGLAIVVLFCISWVPYKLWVDWSDYLEYPAAGIIGVGGILVILAGVLWADLRTARRLREERARLDALLDSFGR